MAVCNRSHGDCLQAKVLERLGQNIANGRVKWSHGESTKAN